MLVVWAMTQIVGEIAARLLADGVLLESARGPVPNVAELVARERIRGSWWAHPQSHRIFATINALGRLDGRRPHEADQRSDHPRPSATVGCAAPSGGPLPKGGTARRRRGAPPSGAHRVTDVPLATWVAADVLREAAQLDERAALSALPAVLLDRLL